MPFLDHPGGFIQFLWKYPRMCCWMTAFFLQHLKLPLHEARMRRGRSGRSGRSGLCQCWVLRNSLGLQGVQESKSTHLECQRMQEHSGELGPQARKIRSTPLCNGLSAIDIIEKLPWNAYSFPATISSNAFQPSILIFTEVRCRPNWTINCSNRGCPLILGHLGFGACGYPEVSWYPQIIHCSFRKDCPFSKHV